jgi:V8-like Glu-specific endopeptidase
VAIQARHSNSAAEKGSARERVKVYEPSASWVKIHFENLDLADGDVLEMKDMNGNLIDRISGRFPKGTWARSVQGEGAILEIVGGGKSAKGSSFRIDQYGYGFPQSSAGTESICGANDLSRIACVANTAVQDIQRSVAKITYQVAGGSWSSCTSFLVSNDSHLLTNNHCIQNQTETNSMEVRFNYQNSACAGTTMAPVSLYMGGTFIMTDYSLDFTLIRVNGSPATQWGFLKLDPRALAANEPIYILQHPSGRPKEYSEGPLITPSVDGNATSSDFSYNVDTEPGSSGSPVLSSPEHAVVGLHHFGGCPNQAVKIERIYPMIQQYISRSMAAVLHPILT